MSAWKRREVFGDATLYLGDCLEVMPELGKVDAVVTDPPYGNGYVPRVNRDRLDNRLSNNVIKNSPVWGPIHGNTDRPPIGALVDHSIEQVIWGAHEFHDLLPAGGGFLVWDKKEGAFEKWTGGDGEIAWTSVKGAVRILNFTWIGTAKKFVEKSAGGTNRKSYHPTEKPVALMEWCLSFLPKARTILDPFMGSGTTGVACMNLGRRFIGIEIEEKYFDIACRRIDLAARQERLPLEAL